MSETLYLVIQFDSKFDRIHEVQAKETVIGRDEDCTLRLPHLSVSRRHSLLLQKPTGFFLRDLDSRNGTRLNGELIKVDAPFSDGDELQIGPYLLTARFNIGDPIDTQHDSDEITASEHFPKASSQPAFDAALPRLTPAQQRVYDGFFEGLSEKEISVRLQIAISTVHDHAKAIYKAFSVSSRAELLTYRDARRTNH